MDLIPSMEDNCKYIELLCDAISVELKDLVGDDYQASYPYNFQTISVQKQTLNDPHDFGIQHENGCLEWL